jgi:ATP-binding cassette subfamily C (CFTR/MRP) protein 1
MLPDLQQPLELPHQVFQNYLKQDTPTVFRPKKEAFCVDPEGWGPVSPIRWDFTPCFLDVWVAIVALFGILFGAGAIWYLFAKRVEQPVRKNWHFYAKFVGTLLLSDCISD